MLSALIIFLGTFWEASMDKIASPRHFNRSVWKIFAAWLDIKGHKRWGHDFFNQDAWKNKWKNKDHTQGENFWGSTHMFVHFTDAWHLFKLIWLLHFFSAIVLYSSISGNLLFDILILYMIFGAGHEIFFRLIDREPL